MLCFFFILDLTVQSLNIGLPISSRSHGRRIFSLRKEDADGWTDDIMLGSLDSSNLDSEFLSPDANQLEEHDVPPLSPQFSPPMTLQKYETMQRKRIHVHFRYTGGAGLKLFFLFAATQLKERFPELVISKTVVPCRSEREREETLFEITIDDKLVYSKRPEKKAVYLEMSSLSETVMKARREKRPKGVYGDPSTYDFDSLQKNASDH